MSMIFFDPRFFIGRFQLHDDRTQAVVAAADGDAWLPDPVSVIKQSLMGAMRQREHILIDGFPRFIAKPFRLGIVRIKDLPLSHQRARAEPLYAIFARQLFIQRRF